MSLMKNKKLERLRERLTPCNAHKILDHGATSSGLFRKQQLREFLRWGTITPGRKFKPCGAHPNRQFCPVLRLVRFEKFKTVNQGADVCFHFEIIIIDTTRYLTVHSAVFHPPPAPTGGGDEERGKRAHHDSDAIISRK